MIARRVLALIAAVVMACTGSPVAATSSASATSTPAPPASRSASPSPAAPLAVEFDSMGQPSSAIPLVDRVIWSADEANGGARSGRILERSLSSGATRVLYQTDATVQRLSESERWLSWVEYADLWNASDARIYAMPFGGGARTLVAEPLRSPDFFGRFFDTALVGDDVYWTVPRMVGGRFRGELYRRKLPDGAPQLVAAADRAIIGWPSGVGQYVLYQQIDQGGYPASASAPGPSHVMRLGISDATERIADGSYPVVSSSFVAYLDTDHRPTARIGGRTVTLGGAYDPGYPPMASGDWLLWGDGFYLHLARPRDGCVKHYNISIGGATPMGSVYTPLGIGATYAAVSRVKDDGRTRTIGLIELANLSCP